MYSQSEIRLCPRCHGRLTRIVASKETKPDGAVWITLAWNCAVCSVDYDPRLWPEADYNALLEREAREKEGK